MRRKPSKRTPIVKSDARLRRLADDLHRTAAELRAGLGDLSGLVEDLENQARRVARAEPSGRLAK
jgi:hypothetical protein